MKFALLRCCVTSVFLKQYESATNAVLAKLGIELEEIKEFNCCGYPLKNSDFTAYALSSERNFALAEKRSLNILTLCNCCYGTLKHVAHVLKDNASLKKEIDTTLAKEDLAYTGAIEPKHLFEVLYHDIGLETIKQKIVKTYRNLNVAVHYGCHLLRPKEVVQFDNPFAPSIFDQLVAITGAKSVPWSTKLECCGAPLWGVNDELSLDLTEKKLVDAKQAGADYVCVICPFCQLQFDRVQRILLSRRTSAAGLPSLVYTQLLGLSLGIDEQSLGVEMNELPAERIYQLLGATEESQVARPAHS
jgi:heterodisulfide reductase subunit B